MAPPASHDIGAAHVRRVLGLSGAASDAEIQAAYWALRAHIEARAAASDDAGFVAARAAELQRLTEELALALGIEPETLPAPQLERARPRPDRAFVKRLGVVIAAAGVLGLVVFLVVREQSPRPHASALAAVASGDPPGRLVFAESELPHRYTVLDASGRNVVRTGITSVGGIDLEPGEYAVWLAGLSCDASQQHSVLVESGAEVVVSGPDCQRTVDLVVRSDVTGDVLRIDGQAVGSTGPEAHALAVGSHEVSVEAEGRSPWRAEIEVGDGERITLYARLPAPAPAETAPANVTRTAPTTEAPAPRGPTAPSGVPPQPRPALEGSEPRTGPAGGVPGGTSTAEIARDGRGGSRSWHEGVVRRLLAKYDTNGSRTLDGTVEIAAIPCSEWLAIESQYEAGGLQVPMTRLYGFDGSDWVDGALGIERGLSDFAYRRMKECGLK